MVYAVNVPLVPIFLVFIYVIYAAGGRVDLAEDRVDAATVSRRMRAKRSFIVSSYGAFASLAIATGHVLWRALLDGGMEASLVALGLTILLGAVAAWVMWYGVVL